MPDILRRLVGPLQAKNRSGLPRFVAQVLFPLGKKVYAVVNYDNFSIEPVDEYREMVKYLVDRCYLRDLEAKAKK